MFQFTVSLVGWARRRYREQAQALLDYGAALRALGTSEGGPLGTSLAAVRVRAHACWVDRV